MNNASFSRVPSPSFSGKKSVALLCLYTPRKKMRVKQSAIKDHVKLRLKSSPVG